MFESGVKYYTRGVVEIHFPEDKVCCAYCPLLETYARKQCRRTGNYILDDKTFDLDCPIVIKGDET